MELTIRKGLAYLRQTFPLTDVPELLLFFDLTIIEACLYIFYVKIENLIVA